jgi:lipopolysaccharide transport system ATP-binding protein
MADHSDDILVSCDSVGKKFCRDLKKSLWYGVRDSAKEFFGSRKEQRVTSSRDIALRNGEFWAVSDVSFQLRRGECLGLLGRNGAGKTTLLKMINGLIKPDSGNIRIQGSVSGLIALGAGFNPILTGRENIYVNGSVLGLSRKNIDEKIEQIIDFAEIGDAIDAPVRTYSSGMQVRLGFASAVNLIAPDVLLLDEVLAVGDLGFVIKCLNKMRDLTSKSAVIFVSHSMPFVSMFCTQAMLMQNGNSKFHSIRVAEVIERYNREFALTDHISGTGEASVIAADFITVRENGVEEIGHHITADYGYPLKLRTRIQTRRKAYLEVYLHTVSVIPVVGSKIVDEAGNAITLSPGEHQLEIDFGNIDLNAGKYPLMISVADNDTHKSLCRVEGSSSLTVKKETVDWGFLSRVFRAKHQVLS